MSEKQEEYTGELPKHVKAQLQEHTAGGYILFRIGVSGEMITDLDFDDERSYMALVKKATNTLKALNKIDDIQALRGFSNSDDDDDDDDDGDLKDSTEENEDDR
jgi:hypothetical protein